MCGRFALTHRPEALEEEFSCAVEAFPPRYNIAPTQPVVVIAGGSPAAAGANRPQRTALLARWGLLPGWVRDTRQFPLLINARAETAAQKASFRAAMRHRRVLLPASGFYEWQASGSKDAQPWWLRPRHGGVVAFGALMETYAEPGGSEIDTAAILTCPANSRIAPIHHRMPVVIRPEDYARWLDCVGNEPRDVANAMEPVGPDFFEAIPVSGRVNKVANTGPELQEEVTPPLETPGGEAPPLEKGQLSLF